jgi:hypothetical protein
MVFGWLATAVFAGEPAAKAPPPVVTEIQVIPAMVEGKVKLSLAGRDGDQVFIDEWSAGVLPVETMLAEGPHLFRVEGPRGAKHEVSIYVTVAADKVTDVDLAVPVAPPAPTP